MEFSEIGAPIWCEIFSIWINPHDAHNCIFAKKYPHKLKPTWDFWKLPALGPKGLMWLRSNGILVNLVKRDRGNSAIVAPTTSQSLVKFVNNASVDEMLEENWPCAGYLGEIAMDQLVSCVHIVNYSVNSHISKYHVNTMKRMKSITFDGCSRVLTVLLKHMALQPDASSEPGQLERLFLLGCFKLDFGLVNWQIFPNLSEIVIEFRTPRANISPGAILNLLLSRCSHLVTLKCSVYEEFAVFPETILFTDGNYGNLQEFSFVDHIHNGRYLEEAQIMKLAAQAPKLSDISVLFYGLSGSTITTHPTALSAANIVTLLKRTTLNYIATDSCLLCKVYQPKQQQQQVWLYGHSTLTMNLKKGDKGIAALIFYCQADIQRILAAFGKDGVVALSITGCNDLQPAFITSLYKNQPNLKNIALHYCYNMMLSQLFCAFTGITDKFFKIDNKVNNLTRISKLDDITDLKLTVSHTKQDCDSVTSELMLFTISLHCLAMIADEYLRDVWKIAKFAGKHVECLELDIVGSGSSMLTALAYETFQPTQFRLSNCDGLVGDANDSLMDAGVYGAHLESLTLCNCSNLPDYSLYQCLRQCPNLRSLRLEGCPVDDEMCEKLPALLPQLQRLDIRNCNYLGKDGLLQILRRCKRLQSFYVEELRELEDRHVEAIALIRSYGVACERWG